MFIYVSRYPTGSSGSRFAVHFRLDFSKIFTTGPGLDSIIKTRRTLQDPRVSFRILVVSLSYSGRKVSRSSPSGRQSVTTEIRKPKPIISNFTRFTSELCTLNRSLERMLYINLFSNPVEILRLRTSFYFRSGVLYIIVHPRRRFLFQLRRPRDIQ